VNSDFRDLLAALNGADARYLVVGGYAVAFHGHPRFTKDLDVWVDANAENAHRVIAAMTAFGAPAGLFTLEELSHPRTVFQLGVAPVRVDILTQIAGLAFEEAWPSRVQAQLGPVPFWVIGRAELVRNKRAAARPSDLADLAALGERAS
jgi:hypothetical protein